MASEDWLCKDEASQRIGNVIKACGIGMGTDEARARSESFEQARFEFSKICNASDDCHWHKVSVIPGRTTCEKADDVYTCYRLVNFMVSPDLNEKTKLHVYKTSHDYKQLAGYHYNEYAGESFDFSSPAWFMKYTGSLPVGMMQ